MASSQALIDKAKNREFYQNFWRTDLLNTIKVDPGYWCFALWCSPCASYLLRKRALYGDMRRYKCCAGYMPCSGRCGEIHCPEFCLATEVCCCFGTSVSSTRFLLQDELNIKTTKCDNCIIAFMVVLGYLACLCRILAVVTGDDEIEELAHVLTCMSDTVYYSVCACMQTQHKIELDKRDGEFGPMTVPPVQQMSRLDQPYAPTVGYPPSYGAPPPYGQPPPPQQGYPAPGYPPAGGNYPPGAYAPAPAPAPAPGYWR
ncbi:uncharacterized protein LOC107766038 [Nicotiana tabacum]|uniref:uncharacterized protein LOC107766038 n=1 Tax=Nicotiana tabacum TaxID=4097 RepID=UPI003F4F11C7